MPTGWIIYSFGITVVVYLMLMGLTAFARDDDVTVVRGVISIIAGIITIFLVAATLLTTFVNLLIL